MFGPFWPYEEGNRKPRTKSCSLPAFCLWYFSGSSVYCKSLGSGPESTCVQKSVGFTLVLSIVGRDGTNGRINSANRGVGTAVGSLP